MVVVVAVPVPIYALCMRREIWASKKTHKTLLGGSHKHTSSSRSREGRAF